VIQKQAEISHSNPFCQGLDENKDEISEKNE